MSKDENNAIGQAKERLEAFAAEQGWDADSKIHLLCDFIEANDMNDELSQYLKRAQEIENDAGV